MIDTPTAGTTWKVGDVINFSGHATDAQSGTLGASALTWSLVLAHCPSSTCHDHPLQTFSGTASGSFVAPDHEYPSHLELRLTATDPGGLSNSTTAPTRTADRRSHIRVEPGRVVAGGRINQPADTVHTHRDRRLDALGQRAVPQAIGGTVYEFVGWSDGGAQTHTLVANASGSYIATYRVRTGGPVITQVSARAGPGRVTITWTTDVPADSQVQYGPTTAYTSSTPLDRTLVTNHSVTITGLARKAQFFFQVLSRDAGGSLSSATNSFRTK